MIFEVYSPHISYLYEDEYTLGFVSAPDEKTALQLGRELDDREESYPGEYPICVRERSGEFIRDRVFQLLEQVDRLNDVLYKEGED